MRQSRATSDASPSATPLTQSLLLALPTELLARIMSLCGSPIEIVHAGGISRHFHELAKEALSLRAEELEYELPAPPTGEEGTLQWLCFVALLRGDDAPPGVSGTAMDSGNVGGPPAASPSSCLNCCSSTMSTSHISL